MVHRKGRGHRDTRETKGRKRAADVRRKKRSAETPARPIPPGAVMGDVSKQSFCPLCHRPRYYYVDKQKTCVQCGQEFVFSGSEQKYWYETLKFHFDSVAIRCPACRRKKRTERVYQAQIVASGKRLKKNPEDPAALLEDAEGRVRCHQLTGRGDLNRAIASSRKAIAIWPKAADALFWEGLAQHLAGRHDKARPLLEQFVKSPASRQRARLALHREAVELLDGA